MEIQKIVNFVKFNGLFLILNIVFRFPFSQNKGKKSKSKYFSNPLIICCTRVTEAPKNPAFQKIQFSSFILSVNPILFLKLFLLSLIDCGI